MLCFLSVFGRDNHRSHNEVVYILAFLASQVSISSVFVYYFVIAFSIRWRAYLHCTLQTAFVSYSLVSCSALLLVDVTIIRLACLCSLLLFPLGEVSVALNVYCYVVEA